MRLNGALEDAPDRAPHRRARATAAADPSLLSTRCAGSGVREQLTNTEGEIAMLRRLSIFAVPAAALLLTAGRAGATTTFFATLTNSQEGASGVSPTNTNGSPRVSNGTATFVLSDDQQHLTMHAVIFGLDVDGTQSAEANDNLAAAHIHAGANNPPTNNGVVWGFFGSPFNDTAPNDFSFTKFAPGSVGGTFDGKWDEGEGNAGTTLSAQLANIFAGRAYINFHSSQFTGGEIRGA